MVSKRLEWVRGKYTWFHKRIVRKVSLVLLFVSSKTSCFISDLMGDKSVFISVCVNHKTVLYQFTSDKELFKWKERLRKKTIRVKQKLETIN